MGREEEGGGGKRKRKVNECFCASVHAETERKRDTERRRRREGKKDGGQVEGSILCGLAESDTKWIIHAEATAIVTVPGRSGFEVRAHLYLAVCCSILYMQCVCMCVMQ